ncbi:DUF799 domain-containing protein [Aestuariispira ectoiniformans]|uniref:DUF799 domain-containing protein n=1 Tax=Aestuariispira ectoiniformans TaxID=2775080 RepID=UPI00223B3F8C|nr:DUF799 domain-containing protein [Aestuariispira ectoiniformans]
MQKLFNKGILLGLVITALTACQTTLPKADYTMYRELDPKSILVVMPVNRSVEVEAPDYFLTTIAKPIAEKGYYVFPVNLVKNVMDEEGMSDADLVHSSDPTVLGELFGADAILYVSIDKWTSQWVVFDTVTTVTFTYTMKSGETGETFWSKTQNLQYSPNQGGGGGGLAGLIAKAVIAAVERAAPNYIPMTRQANAIAVNAKNDGMLPGPYSPEYKSGEEVVQTKEDAASKDQPAAEDDTTGKPEETAEKPST